MTRSALSKPAAVVYAIPGYHSAMEVIREVAPAQLFKISRAMYRGMIDAGLFAPDARLELLEGVLVAKSPMKDPHALAIMRGTAMLGRATHGLALVAPQLPLDASELSCPEPDLALWPLGTTSIPSRALLVIEVADTSLRIDREVKAPIYAGARVPEYWIANLVDNVVERHTVPRRDRYTLVETLERDATVHLIALPEVALSLAELLPEPPSPSPSVERRQRRDVGRRRGA